MMSKGNKTIKIDKPFELQGLEAKYRVDLDKYNRIDIVFNDGYKIVVSDEPTHAKNNSDKEVIVYSPENEIRSMNWLDLKPDEAQYELYNWFLSLEKDDEGYFVEIKRGRHVCGGFL